MTLAVPPAVLVEPMPVAAYWVSGDGRTRLYHGDSEQILSKVELPNVRTVLSDPPYYGNGFAQEVALGLRPWDEVEEGKWLAHLESFYVKWLPAVRTMIEYNTGRAWFFAGPHHLPALARIAYLAGWPVRRLYYATESEALVQFGRPVPDGLAARVGEAFAASTHPPRKERALLDAILSASVDGIVLDPFCGSGTTLAAARRAGLDAWGIELSEAACAEAAAQLVGMP